MFFAELRWSLKFLQNIEYVLVPRESKEIWMNLGSAETHIWNPSKPDRYDHTRNQSQRLLLPSPGGDSSVSHGPPAAR